MHNKLIKKFLILMFNRNTKKRKYMKKIREKSKEFAEHERIAEEKSSDSNVRVEQNATSKSNRQKVK